MKITEDIILSIRSILTRPLESLMLILGLALSIGATASGIAMVEKSIREGRELLESPLYREIIVSAREHARSMDAAVKALEDHTPIVLTANDLEAKNHSPSIEYAYLINSTRLQTLNSDNFAAIQNMVETVQHSDTAEASQAASGDGGKGSGQGSGQEQDTTEARLPGNIRVPDLNIRDFDGPSPLLEDFMAHSVTIDFFRAMRLNPATGDLFLQSDIETQNRVIVLGHSMAKRLFEDGEVLNRQIATRSGIFTIIGTMEETGTSYDNDAFIPAIHTDTQTTHIMSALGSIGRGQSTNIHFTVHNASDLANAEEELRSYFAQSYEGSQIHISVPRRSMEMAVERNRNLSIIILVLASAALLIASVNISNILFSRAIRRKKQIGILAALGASKQAIFLMFMKEGLFLILGGGVVGSIIALGFSRIMNANLEGASINILALFVGMLTASTITFIFTLLPSWQASRIAAAEAIRTE